MDENVLVGLSLSGVFGSGQCILKIRNSNIVEL